LREFGWWIMLLETPSRIMRSATTSVEYEPIQHLRRTKTMSPTTLSQETPKTTAAYDSSWKLSSNEPELSPIDVRKER